MAVDMQNYVRRVQTRDGASRFNFTVSLPLLALILVALLLTLGWSFYMGYIIGRGQNPEEHLQNIAALWLGSDAAKARAAEGTGDGAAGDAAAVAGAGQAQGSQAQGGATPAPAGAAAPEPGKVPGYPTFPGSPNDGQAPASAAAQEPGPARAQAGEAEREKAPYTFVYRMATVRSQEDARNEQDRYESKGFRTSIRRLGKSWALQYTFKGTDRDCDQFLRDVKRAGLGEPLRVSRKKN